MSRKKDKRMPEHIPFQHIEQCPHCGSRDLRILHNRKYPAQDGIVQLVIYRCPNGHEFQKRQLVVRQFNVPPKEDWEGW